MKSHLLHVFDKLSVDDRAAAVTVALERRLLTLDGGPGSLLQVCTCKFRLSCRTVPCMEDEPRQVTELELLRLLAQPVRRRINELLRQGPASATTLARALGESTGLTSYHLREMARFGLVEEVPELARGRERWWRSAKVDLRFPRRSAQSPEQRQAFEHLQRVELEEDLAAFQRFEQARERLGPWGDALLFSRGVLRVTPEELLAFFDDYIALLNRYDRPDEEVPPDARVLLARFVAFPDVPEDDAPP